MLGAGASLSSGVKPTRVIMEELLAKYGQDLTEGDLRERFDSLWRRSDENARDMFLRPYLELSPSPGWHDLARLIIEGYFDTVITFNFDQLLETALREAGYGEHRDFLVVIRGEYRSDEAVRRVLEASRPRMKILKLHGSLKGGENFLFTRAEMHQYPEEVRNLLLDLTRQQILVCGYAFEDFCVVRAFSEQGSNIFCVNPAGAPPNLKPFLIKRNSMDWVFDKEEGNFDTFFRGLREAIARGSPPVVAPKANPFKFLVSYDVGDKEWYYGRGRLIKEVLAKLSADPSQVLHLVGPPKAGKTSFVRAGLIAGLDPERVRPVYLRCQGQLDTWLAPALAKAAPATAGAADASAALNRLAEATTKTVLLVLDQFERVVKQFRDTEAGQRGLLRCLGWLSEHAPRNLTFLCVSVDTPVYLKALLNSKAEAVDVPPLAARRVGAILRYLARKAGIQFERAVLRKLMEKYEETQGTPKPFSLAHVQAVCNILAASNRVDLAGYNKVIEHDGEALDMALNVCDIVSFVEDIPDEAGRTLFRKVMKVIPVESKKVLATYLKEHFDDLLTPPEYPQTRSSTPGGVHG